MASLFGHVAVAAVIDQWIAPEPKLENVTPLLASGTSEKSVRNTRRLILMFALLSSILPDIDVLTFKFGIHYASPWGHRGFTHSLFFAALWSLLLVLLPFFKMVIFRFRLYLLFFSATISHGLLDALTNGGLGVGFLTPFVPYRYFFEIRPIQVSPIWVNHFFSQTGWLVIKSELLWIGVPCLALWILHMGLEMLFAKSFKTARGS